MITADSAGEKDSPLMLCFVKQFFTHPCVSKSSFTLEQQQRLSLLVCFV